MDLSKPILVTGASGFLGRHLTELMDELEIPYFATDLGGFEGTSEWDIRQPFPYDIDLSGIIHLAGVLGTHELFDNIDLAIDVNIKGTVNVLNEARSQKIPFRGITMAHVWVNPYETTKMTAERLATAWGREYGFDVSYSTVYNAYGPYQAHGPGHPQKIVPTFVIAALTDQPIPIWGDGSQMVDLVHARDVARVLLGPPEFEGGRGIPLTVEEVARMVWSLVRNDPPKIEYLPMRKGEHPPSRDPVANSPIGRQTDLEAGLRETIKWYRESYGHTQDAD